jgi:hypothetical protein
MRRTGCVLAVILTAAALAGAPAGTLPATTFEGSPALVLANDRLALTILSQGGTFASLVLADDPERLNPLWNPVRMNRELGRDAPPTSTAGHFVCVDGFGPASPDERAAGLPMHGEAHLQPYAVRFDRTGSTSEVTLSATLPLVQEAFVRSVRLVDGEQVVYVDSRLDNLLAFDRPVHWGEHATVGSPFVEPGVTVFDLSGTRSRTRAYQQPVSATDPRMVRRLESGRDFAWPAAPGLNGVTVDVRQVPEQPHYIEHVATRLDPARPVGWATALNTARGLIVGYLFPREDYPWVQTWGSYPPTGKLARGIEFATQPFDVPRRDVISAGPLFETPTFRWLPAKSSITARFLLFYARTPRGFTRVDDVRMEGGQIVVVDRAAGLRVTLTASQAERLLGR